MERRRFTREFKVEAVKLVRERGVAVRQAARDLNVHENVLRKWVKEFGADPQQAFPGHGQMKPEQLEIERLRREVQKLKAERDILKARPRRRRRLPPDVCERQAAAVAPNVLDRAFAAPAPNRRWIADFTYVWTAECWLFLAWGGR